MPQFERPPSFSEEIAASVYETTWWRQPSPAEMLKDTITLRVFGPPGAGKTFTLLQLIQDRVNTLMTTRDISVEDALRTIMFVSYTRNGAHEGRSRMETTFNVPPDRVPYFRTLHSTCWHLLSLSDDEIVTPKWLKAFGEKHHFRFSSLVQPLHDDVHLSPFTAFDDGEIGDWCLGCWDLARNRCEPDRIIAMAHEREAPKSLRLEPVPHMLQDFILSYENAKKEDGVLDYTDWLIACLMSDKTPHVETIYADEAQDFSRLHWALLLRWACRDVNPLITDMVVAGDDDQSMFIWNGASPELLLDFPATYTDVLSQSHRLPPSIHIFSNQIITRNTVRHPKEFLPATRPDAGIRVIRDISEINLSTEEKTFILVRNRILGRPIVDYLTHAHIPFRNRTSSFDPLAPSTMMDAILVAFSLSMGESVSLDDVALLYRSMVTSTAYGDRLFSYGAKSNMYQLFTDFPRDRVFLHDLVSLGMMQETVDILHDHPLSLLRLGDSHGAYLRSLIHAHGAPILRASPRVTVSTYHQIKGEECDHAICSSDMSRRTYTAYRSSVAGRESENRVYYVGVTRARSRVSILLPTTDRFFEWPSSIDTIIHQRGLT